MSWIVEKDIEEFLNAHNYDIRALRKSSAGLLGGLIKNVRQMLLVLLQILF